MTDYDPPQTPLDICHQDHDLLVVDKPAGLLAVPGRGAHLADCLLTRVQAAFPEALLVHRLDRDTSGVMVFGLSPAAQRHLSRQFEQRQVKKTYIALVDGCPEAREGRIDLPLIVDWPNRPRQKVDPVAGRQAITDWALIGCEDGVGRLRLRPQTGRSHQLRVHCAALGHAILGDPFYGTLPAPRMMLHAQELRLSHPESGKGIRFYRKAAF